MQVPTENTQYDRPIFTFTLNAINTLTNLFLGAVAFGAFTFASLIRFPDSLKSHIYLCVLGYVILMAQAVLSLNPYNGWSNALSHKDKKNIHWLMQVVGSILAIAGSILRLTSSDRAFVAPFQTTHGIIGFVAMILAIANLIGGVLNMYSSNLKLNTTFIRMCHSVLGSFVLIAAFVALCLAYDNMYRIVMGDANANTMIAFTILALIGTLVPIYMRIFKISK